MALSTLRRTTSPHLSVIKLNFSSINRTIENIITDMGNDLRRIADEIARIGGEFQGAVKFIVVPDSHFELVLNILNVRFCFVGWKRPRGHIDSSSFALCRSFSTTIVEMGQLFPSLAPFDRSFCGAGPLPGPSTASTARCSYLEMTPMSTLPYQAFTALLVSPPPTRPEGFWRREIFPNQCSARIGVKIGVLYFMLSSFLTRPSWICVHDNVNSLIQHVLRNATNHSSAHLDFNGTSGRTSLWSSHQPPMPHTPNNSE